MAVVVARADRDQRDPRLDGADERWVLVPAAVVGDLQHVGGEVSSPAQQITLRLELDVPGREDRHLAHADPRYDRGVVGIRASADVTRHRAEHLDPRIVHDPDLPGFERNDRYAGLVRHSTDLGSRVGRRRSRARGNGTHTPPTKDSDQTVDVIGM